MTDSPDAGSISIGEGVKLTGRLDLPGVAHIHGEIDGEVVAEEIVLGASGKIRGSVTAAVAEIRGEIEKDVTITRSLVLRSTAKVRGHINYETLEIEQGATIEGELKRGIDAAQRGKTPGKGKSAAAAPASPAEDGAPAEDKPESGPFGGNWV